MGDLGHLDLDLDLDLDLESEDFGGPPERVGPDFPLSPDRKRSVGRKYGMGPIHNPNPGPFNTHPPRTYGTLLTPPHSMNLLTPQVVRQRK